MRRFTQTSVAPAVGNCWQTAVACLLEVEPATLPDQASNDYVLVDGKWQGKSYNNILQAYLRKHHGLVYLEVHVPAVTLAGVFSIRKPGWHLITGRTVRSDSHGGMRHVVVGRYGKVEWDPHPSRAGLTDGLNWAFLVPIPPGWDGAGLDPCVCPACASGAA